MKILLTSDIHLRDKPPSTCTDDYLLDLFTLLNHMAGEAYRRKVSAVVIAGDLFDNKIPAHNSHKLVQVTIELLKSFSCPVFVVPGNHDMSHDRFDSVFETQPLGTIIRSGAAHLLSGWSDRPIWREVSYSGLKTSQEFLPIYGVPWLPEWDHEDGSDKERAIAYALEGLDVDEERFGNVLVVAHAPFFPPGRESPFESYSTSKFAVHLYRAYSGPKSVYYGHIHEYHGIYEVDGIEFANAGALSRGSLHEYNLNRPICLTEWDSETGRFDIFEIPHKPASEIFKLEEVQETKIVKIELDKFISSIGETTLEISSTESIVTLMHEKDVEKDVVKLVEELLNEAKK